MLKASTFNDLLLARPDQLDELVRQYAHFIRSIHAVKMDPGDLPEAKDVFLGYLDALREMLPEALYGRLVALFDAIPEDLHVVHGDIQMKNVMVSDGEPILIDMDTLSVGDPVFEFAILRRNPYPLIFRCIRESGITAFFTRSSAANIPVNMRLCERLGLDKDVYSVSIPLGATINMDGAAVVITIMTLATVRTLSIPIDIPSAILLPY